MTEILFQRLKKKFPPINDYERITIYEAYERIYLDLIEKEFSQGRYFNPKKEIKDLALEIFDTYFISKSLCDGGQERLAIIFLEKFPSKISYKQFMYNTWYSGHSFDISLPASHPVITISTGNRGRTDLLDRQRDLYYNFVEGIYNLFMEKIKL